MALITFLTGHNTSNIPAKYRALMRAAKRGTDVPIQRLLAAARNLNDPYYTALALFNLSKSHELENNIALSIAEEALNLVNDETRHWRRAELITGITREIKTWRPQEPDGSREKFLDIIWNIIDSFPEGKGLSDAIAGCSPLLGSNRLKQFLNKALSNKGFELQDAKLVLRQWSRAYQGTEPPFEEIMKILMAIDDNFLSTKLIGYFHLQCQKLPDQAGNYSALETALRTASSLDSEKRLEILRDVARQASAEAEFKILYDALDSFEDRVHKARFIITLIGNADRAGLKDLVRLWFKKGIEICSEIENLESRILIKYKLGKTVEKSGEKVLATDIYQSAFDECGNNDKLKEKLSFKVTPQKLDVQIKPDREKVFSNNLNKPTEAAINISSKSQNNIFALYNTYKGGLNQVHFRAIARAAPLCAAFGLDLALMGFPIKDLNGLIKLVLSETKIGKGGKYFKELVGQGRVTLLSGMSKEPPIDWIELGLLVATTSEPNFAKKVKIDAVLALAKSQHPEHKACFIVGLGKKGLPQNLLNHIPYHLELTGNNIPLETCTAMGVIAQQINYAENRLGDENKV